LHSQFEDEFENTEIGSQERLWAAMAR
jgi:hypothetical protein